MLYRLDRIQDGIVHKLPKLKSLPLTSSESALLERLSYAWGTDFPTGSEPFNVKIKIFAHTENLISKIKSDTSRRTSGRL